MSVIAESESPQIKWSMLVGFCVSSLFLCLFASCTTQSHSVEELKIETNSPVGSRVEEPAKDLGLSDQTAVKAVSQIKWFSETLLVRQSETKDERGWMVRPYSSAQIVARFEVEPIEFNEVTVVPLNVKIASFNSKIRKVTKTPVTGCKQPNDLAFYWSVELESITAKEILEVGPVGVQNDAQPFSVFVIYPSVQIAKAVEKSTVSKSEIPEGITLSRVSSAIDLDNDEQPDLISVLYCCDDFTGKSAEKCPYLCSKYYRKVEKRWELFYLPDKGEGC